MSWQMCSIWENIIYDILIYFQMHSSYEVVRKAQMWIAGSVQSCLQLIGFIQVPSIWRYIIEFNTCQTTIR